MKIDSKKRYFVFRDEAAQRFLEHREKQAAALVARMQAGKDFIVEQGCPEEDAEAHMYERSFTEVYFAKSARRHLPKILTKPDRNDLCRIKANLKLARELQDRVVEIPVESDDQAFPTLHIHACFFMGSHMQYLTVGKYGDHVVLIGLPKSSTYEEIKYEVDEEILRELTLSEWAALVEKNEGGE